MHLLGVVSDGGYLSLGELLAAGKSKLCNGISTFEVDNNRPTNWVGISNQLCCLQAFDNSKRGLTLPT
jgi:hypothetical protein